MSRLLLLVRLVTATARRIAWPSLLATLTAGVAVAWLLTRSEPVTTEQALTALRWTGVLLAAGLASVLDDPTEADLAGAGTPIWRRRLAAIGVAMPATAAAWWAALLIADRTLPWGAVSIEAGALIALGIATASLRPVRRTTVPAALAAVPLPVLVLIIALLLPPSLALYVLPDDPAWAAAHGRWALLGAVGVLVAAVAARDPARRSPWRLLVPARPRTTTPPSTVPASELS